MNKRKFPLVLLFILISAFLVAPVAAGLTVTDGEKIIQPYGVSSSVITISSSDIPAGGTITIDIPYMFLYVNSGQFNNANIIVSSNAAAATWTGAVSGAGDVITLTSAGGNTTVGENITVTFTGAKGNRWVTDTYGDQSMLLAVTRSDTAETASITFRIETVTLPPGGLTVTDGVKITSSVGSSSPVITIINSDIPENGTIIIEVPYLWMYTKSGTFTNANVIVSDTAAAATWTGTVAEVPGVYYSDYIILKAIGGPTVIGENITVTFTGAGGNPWLPDTSGYQEMPVTVARTDTGQTASLNFMIDTTPPPGGISVADGAKITTANGATQPVITISDTVIPVGGTITIDVSGLNPYVTSGSLTDANVEINDTAAAATWTRSVAGTILTLTPTGGATVAGETILVTFTGAGGNPWIPNTHGEQRVPLTATRTDTSQKGSFNFIINTTPPSGYLVVANFTASQTSESAPLTVTFRDTSLGNPTSWSWDFGDGETSSAQNPVHTYPNIGTYTVILTATNSYGSDTMYQWNYIRVLNSATSEASTSIPGLTVSTCKGPQSIIVNTSILPAALFPNNSVIELQPLIETGFKNITLYAQAGKEFSRNGDQIAGKLAGVHFVSDDIAPLGGFSANTGANSSFSYNMYLSSYPCDMKINTKIWEGAMTEYDNKLRQIVDKNNAGVIGTAYTAKITKTNFPPNTRVKLHMNVDPNWNPSLPGGPGMLFIWRISDDGTTGQILPTTNFYSDPVNNLENIEADSPNGLSIFGLSSFTGNNNPFQLVSFVAAQVINAAAGGGGQTQPVAVQATSVPEITPSGATDMGKTVKIYSNPEGTVSQQSILTSTDSFANLSIGLGIVAKNSNGTPLSSISITRVTDEKLPAGSPGDGLSYTGLAYELQPDGVTFSPSVPFSFTIPQGQWGSEYVIEEYDHSTGTWQALQSSYDPKTGTITAPVSHLCCIALFARAQAAENPVVPTPTPTIIISSKSSMSTNVEMYRWLLSFIIQNPVIIVIILAVFAFIGYFWWWKRKL